MRYFSLEKNEFIDINFENIEKYKNKIDEIVSKILFDFQFATHLTRRKNF